MVLDLERLDQAADFTVNQTGKERSAVVKNNFTAAFDVNPDQEMEARRLAGAAQVPVETARAIPQQVKQQQVGIDLEKLDLGQRSPVTSEFFTNPENVRVAKDDIQSLTELEYQFTPEAQRLKGPFMQTYYGPEPTLGSIGRGIISSLASGLALTREGLYLMSADLFGWDLAAERSIQEIERIRAQQEIRRPNFRSGIASAIYSGAESLAQNAPGLAASLISSNPVPALATAGVNVQAEAYSRYRQRGADPSQAFLASLGEGGVEIATELLPMSVLVNRLGKDGIQELIQKRAGSFTKDMVEYGIAEVPGEQIATFVQDAIDTAVANPDKTWNDFANERPDAAYQTLIATLTGTTVFAGTTSGARYIAGRGRESEDTRASDLVEAARQSKLRQRDPNLFQQFMEQATEQDPNLSEFYVSPDALNQSGINLEDLPDLSPEMLSELTNAAATGRDARISVPEFTARLVDTPTGEALLDHIKLSPQAMSRAEARQYMREEGEQLRQEVERALDKSQNTDAFQQSKQQVENAIAELLNQTQRFTDDVNRANATLAANYYATQAQRLGITPEEMYQRHPINVQAAPTVNIDEQVLPQGLAAQIQSRPARVGRKPDIDLKLEPYGTSGRTLKFSRGGENIGEGLVYKSGETTRIESVFLKPDARGRNLGNQALDLVVSQALDMVGSVPGQLAADVSNRQILEMLTKRLGVPSYISDDIDTMSYNEALARLPSEAEAQSTEITGPFLSVRWDDAGKAKSRFGRYADSVAQEVLNQETNPAALAGVDLSDPAEAEAAMKEWQEKGVESKYFKKWFGDSKVVDKDGKPLVVYHGINAHVYSGGSIEAFITQGERGGSFFSSSENVANQYGEAVYPVYLSIKNPLIVYADGSGWSNLQGDTSIDGKITQELRDKHQKIADEFTAIFAELSGIDGSEPTAAKSRIGSAEDSLSGKTLRDITESSSDIDGIAKAARKLGYDGVVVRDVKDSPVPDRQIEDSDTFVAFSPEQIKSVHNRGTFDANDARILYQGGDASNQQTGMKRLYRGLEQEFDPNFDSSKSDAPSGYSTWTDNIDLARQYAGKNGRVYFIDLPVDKMGVEPIDQEGDRVLFFDNEKPAGLNGVSGKEFLVYTDHEDYSSNAIREVDARWLNQQNRGAFDPSTNTISLLENADLSTFLHEFGHFMLEMQTDLAAQEQAPEQIKKDMDALLKWFKVEGDTAQARMARWQSLSLEEKRESHELLARGFESYLMEGKAPSAELREFFQRFRDWLVSVYKNLRNLNVKLTPEVRQVFDRMLATDAAIQEAEDIARYEPLFKDAQKSGMTDEEFVRYQQMGAEATADAKSALDRRNMRNMQWLSNARSKRLKQFQARADAKRKAVRAEVTDEVLNEPVYRAMQFLKKGTIDGQDAGDGYNKLSIAEIEAMYGDNPIVGVIKKELGYGKYGMLGEKNGVHPDQVAELFGYSSGDQLIRALLAAEPARQRIDGLTDQRMVERYGDLTDEASVEKAVMESLRNDTRARFVAAEASALNAATGGRKVLTEAAKLYSDEMVSRQRIRDIRPHQYEVAESRAARQAQQAFAKSDLELAAAQKRNQLINLHAAKAARKALDDVEKGLAYFKRFDRARKGKSTIDASYLDQIQALLERYDLRRVTNKELNRRASLREWVESQKEQGIEPDIPPSLLDGTQRRSYKEMSVTEFRGLRDTIKQIEHLGRLKNKLLTAKGQREFDAAKAEMLAAIEGNAPNKTIDLRTRSNAGGTLKEMGVNFLAMHRKMASLLREMDGFKDAGPLWQYITRTMNEAGDKEAVMREQATLRLADITQGILAGPLLGGKGQFFPSVGMSLNREERISIALNLGNEGNAQRLLDGEGWTQAQLEPILDTLTKEDWDFVQSIWDYFEAFRPEIAAKERRVYGKEPDWVEPKPVPTKFGEYRGGYYPIKYDTKRSGASQQFQEAESAKQMMQSAYTASTTRRSFTKNRAEEVKGRPLLYSFQGIYQGTEEIIHDLSHHEWLIDVNKILRDKDIDKSIRRYYGAEAAELIRRAVRDIAQGNQPAQNVWERGLNHVRMGSTVAGLGWNTITSLLQPLGLTNSMARIGPGWVGRGLTSWFKSPLDTVEEIYQKSDFMRLRAKTMQRELNEIQNRMQSPSTAQAVSGKVLGRERAQKTKEWVDWSMFLTIQKMQLVADVPTWLGQYEKSIAEGHSDETAARLADQAVIDSQGGGQTKDLAEIQRGGPMQKLWTNFYSYFNVVYNLNAEIKNKTDWRDPYEVAVAARDYLLVMVVPAVLGKMLRDAITGDDDAWDADQFAKGLAAEQISYLFGTMIGVRETAAIAQRIAGVSDYNFAYGGPAGLRIFQELDKLGTQVSQGKPDRALRKSLINTSGIIFHLPAAQINRTLDGLLAVAEGDAGPMALIGGAPR